MTTPKTKLQTSLGRSGKTGIFRNASFHRNTSAVTFEVIGGVCAVLGEIMIHS